MVVEKLSPESAGSDDEPMEPPAAGVKGSVRAIAALDAAGRASIRPTGAIGPMARDVHAIDLLDVAGRAAASRIVAVRRALLLMLIALFIRRTRVCWRAADRRTAQRKRATPSGTHVRPIHALEHLPAALIVARMHKGGV
jgi:hypothetical protein